MEAPEEKYIVRDLSLHILDILENAIRATATVIFVTVEADASVDTLRVSLEDNGPGFAVTPDLATNPFFTTKSGKRTGLGLSLLKASAERAEGKLQISQSSLGGARVEAVMKLSHVDRLPLGDLAATFSGIVATHPELDVRLCLRADGREFVLRSSDVACELGERRGKNLAVAKKFFEQVHDAQVLLGCQ